LPAVALIFFGGVFPHTADAGVIGRETPLPHQRDLARFGEAEPGANALVGGVSGDYREWLSRRGIDKTSTRAKKGANACQAAFPTTIKNGFGGYLSPFLGFDDSATGEALSAFNSPSSRMGDGRQVGESSVAFVGTVVAGMRSYKPKNRIAFANSDAREGRVFRGSGHSMAKSRACPCRGQTI